MPRALTLRFSMVVIFMLPRVIALYINADTLRKESRVGVPVDWNFNLSGCTSVGVNPFSFSFIFRLLFTLKLIFLLLGTILLTILLVLAFRIRASIFVCKILNADFFPIFYN